jgi:hypothetical protein
MQECVTLSVTEAELVAMTNCIQDMLYIKNVVESMALKVKLPMKVEVDNKGAKDIVNNWSVGGRTRHVRVRLNFLRDHKEEGVIEIQWISTHDNCADILTKNLPAKVFEKHAMKLCSDEGGLTSREGVREQQNIVFEVMPSDVG